MNEDIDKKLERMLDAMPRPQYDIDAWLEEDETEVFDSIVRRRRQRRTRRWLAVAACLLLLIGIGVKYGFDRKVKTEYLPSTAMTGQKAYRVEKSPYPSHLSSEGRGGSGVSGAANSCREFARQIPNSHKKNVRHNPRNAGGFKGASRGGMDVSDTLGSGIWRSPGNVATALRILSECEETIEHGERTMRNHIIEATFRATPQPANVILVSDENGNYEVIETKSIVEL